MSEITIRFTNLDQVYGPGDEIAGLMGDIYEANATLIDQLVEEAEINGEEFDVNLEEVEDAQSQTTTYTDTADDEGGDDSESDGLRLIEDEGSTPAGSPVE